MGKQPDKKAKRKQQLQDRARHHAEQEAKIFCEGQRYRSEPYMPLMFAAESWLCIRDKLMRRHGMSGLTDTAIGIAYRELIIRFEEGGVQEGGAPALVGSDAIGDLSHMAAELADVIARSGKADMLSLQETLGTLRTLNSSRRLRRHEQLDDRAYIDFLRKHLPVSTSWASARGVQSVKESANLQP